MSDSGWLFGLLMCAAVFLPAAGTRTAVGRRWLLGLGTVAMLVIGSLMVASATQSGQGFFPSAAGYGFLLVGIPLGAAFSAAGAVLVATRSTGISDRLRAVLATAGFLGAPAVLIWRLLA